MNFKISPSITPNIAFKKEPSNSKIAVPVESSLEKSPKSDSFELSIGYVNDTHGQTNNMMRILSGIKGDVKLSAGDNDIGDEKNKAIHKATVKFLNIADIKATALGNHEFDTTQEDLIDSIAEYKGDILAANVSKQMIHEEDEEDVKRLGRASLEDYIEDSKVIEVKGEKIGLIGASPSDMLDRLTHPEYHKDCFISNLDETIIDIQNEVNKFKQQGINKVILLSHLGHKKDKEVAKRTDGVDIILGGHTHELIKDIVEGENLFYSKSGEPVVITEAGRDGNYFGELKVEFDKNGVLTKAQNNIGETGLFHKNMINQYVFDEILGKPEKVGYIEQAPPPPKSLTEENPHANFVCDIMREESGAEIALWHNCGVRNFFHEGVIDSRDIKDISPFLDYVVVANVSEKSLVELFKKAISDTYSSSSRKPGLFAVSGLNYTVNPEKKALVDMTYIDKKGNKHKLNVNNPSEEKQFTVVTDEFLMSAGADFNVLANEEDYLKKYSYDKDIMVCNYLKKHPEPVVINQTGRIKYEESK